MVAITKLHTLRNIGLFENGTPTPVLFSKANLIYAENGRGKTTLATVLRSCGENDAAALLAKQTLDSGTPPKVGIQAETLSLHFDNGSWSNTLPNVVIFDGEFVERNVYTGHEVRAEQRQSLLEFVLGDSAVTLKQEVDKLTAEGAEATRRRTKADEILAAYRGTMPLKDFRTLPENQNLDKELEALKNQVAVARQQNSILKRPDLALATRLSFDIAPFFAVLREALPGVQQSAEALVRTHIGKNNNAKGLEGWISRGQEFIGDDTCPFCGQELNGLALIQAYQSYFDAAYNALKSRIGELDKNINNKLSESVWQGVKQTADTNTERATAWTDQLQLSIALLDSISLNDLLSQLRVDMLGLAEKKRNAPLEVIGTDEEIQSVTVLITQFNQLVDAYNASVNAANSQISAFKAKLAAADVAKLEVTIKQLEIQKARHSHKVVEAFTEYDSAETLRKDCEQKKTDARGKLDQLMATTLSQYRDEINHWLKKFGAAFSIEEMKPNYQGGGLPRTEYGLKVRECSVKLGTRDTTGPSFGNTLSEGDKRTLAFAFFLARLFQRADKNSLIVVVDDPVSSFDKNRRSQSKFVIGRIANEVEQMIVLSHDAYFLQDLERYLADKVKVPLKVNEVKRVEHGYSAIGDCDLDVICASEYFRHYVMVQEFADGVGAASIRDVAKALRQLVEGHLHRRFPRHIKSGVTLGVVIDGIRNAQVGNPLVSVQNKAPELVEFNEYASRYHHDTNPAAETEPVTDAELHVYAKQALALIHTGSF